MTKVFIDYQQAVWAYYLKKKEGNSLSYGLAFLTPAKLKKDCEMRCKKGLNKRDEKVIRLFCGELDVSKSCETIIKRCDTDRFRPLVNFLKEGTNKPEEKNVELPALLLEFPGRPWDLWKDNPTLEEQADKPFLDEGVQSEEKGVLPEKKRNFRNIR
ncbi:hypothetical protein MKQ70_02675 [Chitinophaga sedimenti]|uniref:hypothetical protein n=1 Tax=Chitinophaga sedimenti TaxID=2033606 RepID=UPI0020054EBB|nr:hypothetical protein [Chitinophaga sedimenti]MCK7553969.1 hypothetical protein [Chitinophaga sedimenti]